MATACKVKQVVMEMETFETLDTIPDFFILIRVARTRASGCETNHGVISLDEVMWLQV